MKPEVLHLGYYGMTLRWMKDGHWTVTLNWHSAYFSWHGRGYIGLRVDWKEFVIGWRIYRDSSGSSFYLHPLPMVEIPIHWRKKEPKCAIKATSSQSTSPLSVI
jgi:hypothetical protein